MTERDYFNGSDWSLEGQNRNRRYEELYKLIQPYIEQTQRWKVGMRYQFCPEMWPVSCEEVESLKRIGRTVGKVLQAINQPPVGFRIDFVQDVNDKFWITEVQTDDRGLPEMAILRNAYGDGNFPKGVTQSFIEALSKKFPDSQTVGIIFPDNESFYYASFYDLALICRAQIPKQNICVLREKEIIEPIPSFRTGQYPYETVIADIVYDFTQKFSRNNNSCFSPVGKDLLVKLLTFSGDKKCTVQDKETLNSCVPPTFNTVPENCGEKQNWVIKPIDGRWSKGVTFGRLVDRQKWEIVLEQVKSGKAVVQKFVMPKTETLRVRTTKNGDVFYPQSDFVLRIEGYYFFDGQEYALADIMITGTKQLPVHGQRDCIMVPGKVVF